MPLVGVISPLMESPLWYQYPDPRVSEGGEANPHSPFSFLSFLFFLWFSFLIFLFTKLKTETIFTNLANLRNQTTALSALQDLRRHSSYVEHVTLERVHTDMVRQVRYLPENGYLLSASTSTHHSLSLLDELGKKRTYVFNVTKVGRSTLGEMSKFPHSYHKPFTKVHRTIQQYQLVTFADVSQN